MELARRSEWEYDEGGEAASSVATELGCAAAVALKRVVAPEAAQEFKDKYQIDLDLVSYSCVCRGIRFSTPDRCRSIQICCSFETPQQCRRSSAIQSW